VEWINPTTNKRQIYFDDLTERTAEIEARTLRMHHPNADVRVVRRNPQGGEPLVARTARSGHCTVCGVRTTAHGGRCRTCKSALFHANKRVKAEGLVVDTAGGAWWIWDAKGDVVVTGKPTRLEALVALQRGDTEEVEDSPQGGEPSEAREIGRSEGDAVPWVRITRDPKLYEEGIKRAKEIGPIDSGRQIYELLSPALSEENQEVFLVVLCNLRQECIGVAEVHRGERSRVSVSRADILQVVTKSGADHFHVVHNHPSGDPTPSEADRKLTEAIQDGAAEVEIPCVDHVVIGMGKFYSFAEGKVTKVR
jgi:proteasome lid subunit RPN8/RPN11